MRTEYINTLESDVAERDQLIDAIRVELGSTKSENAALQQEIKALKKALLGGAGRASSPALPPPSPLPISASSPAARSTASSSSLLTPNMHKDLPSTSPRLAAKGFWGGSSTTFGGITPVHTVTIPDLIAGAAIKPTLQENINPSLNTNSSANSIGLATLGGAGKPAPFDSFADSNPFTMKVLDAYVSFYHFSLLGMSDCRILAQVPYAAVDSPCTATTTTTTHFYSAAPPAVCFAVAPATHRPCGWPPPTLFHYCRVLAQFLCDADTLLPQRQTSRHPIFLRTHIPHATLHTQARLYVRFRIVGIISDATTGGARVDGLADARAAPRQRILASLLRFLLTIFPLTLFGVGCWPEHDSARASLGRG